MPPEYVVRVKMVAVRELRVFADSHEDAENEALKEVDFSASCSDYLEFETKECLGE